MVQRLRLPPGALRIADLGYYSLDLLGELDHQGVYWLSRVQSRAVILDREGHRLDLRALLEAHGEAKVDLPILLGARNRIPCRLLAVRVPPKVAKERRRRLRYQAKRKGNQKVSKATLALADWTILVTNALQRLLSVDDALVLCRARWQIELLFKLWKSHGQVDEWRSTKPWRILCELYAKLLAMLIQHWVMLVGCWRYADRSLVKAAQTIRGYALMIASALAGVIDLTLVINRIKQCLSFGCRMNRRRKNPNTYQILMDNPRAA